MLSGAEKQPEQSLKMGKPTPPKATFIPCVALPGTRRDGLSSAECRCPAVVQRRARRLATETENGTETGNENDSGMGVRMIVDADVGTGYAILNSLKGVVIGPTVNEIMAAVCGGTVGVMGTIIALEVNRQKVKERKQCPYCHGTGTIPCGTCYSIGYVPSASAVTAQEACSPCAQTGYLKCNHCEGDGRLIPWVYERAMRSQFEDYVYTAVDDYYQDEPPYV